MVSALRGTGTVTGSYASVSPVMTSISSVGLSSCSSRDSSMRETSMATSWRSFAGPASQFAPLASRCRRAVAQDRPAIFILLSGRSTRSSAGKQYPSWQDLPAHHARRRRRDHQRIRAATDLSDRPGGPGMVYDLDQLVHYDRLPEAACRNEAVQLAPECVQLVTRHENDGWLIALIQ